MSKKAVITLHGIRTRGEWQKRLVPILAKNGMVPYPLDYGNFSALDLLSSRAREKKLHWLREMMDFIRQDSGDPEPSIVAHSFGTYLAGKLIRDFPAQYFDKVILVGSILPTNFPWQKLLAAGQVQWVLNEYGGLDIWPQVASRLIKDAGDAGTQGFTDKSPFLVQRGYDGFGHSSYFMDGHYQTQWLPTLMQNRRQFAEQLRDRVTMMAGLLRISEQQISVQVFLSDGPKRLTVDAGLSLRQKSDQVTLSFSRPYSENTPQGMVIEAFQAGNGSENTFLGISTEMSFDAEVFPVHDSMRYFITQPVLSGEVAIGVLAISLKEGTQSLREEEVTGLASQLAQYTIGL